MFRSNICFILVFLFQISFCQNQFQFINSKNKTTIPFVLINNLVIISVEVNGVPLNFLLDTGIQETILFSLDETNEIVFSNTERIKMKGFGVKELFIGYKSTKNILKINNIEDTNHTIYLVLDQDVNISSQVGIPINGIIGYKFFKNQLVKIDYESKKITIFKDNNKLLKRLKRYSKIPLTLHDGKPYILAKSVFKNSEFETKLLIDTGNSDAIWLFRNSNSKIKIPTILFEDYLGRGFSGDVFGHRARINEFKIDEFSFQKPLVAFPDTLSTKDIDNIYDRNGSIGAELTRRFTIVFDYQNSLMYLKMNKYFDEEFSFNMSGIDVQHQGMQWVQESYVDHLNKSGTNVFDANGDKLNNKLKYKFELKPIYIIANVRKNSPADLAGLQKDDIIIKINRRYGYSFTLQQIIDLLKSEEGKFIEFHVERKGKPLKFKFQLKSII